MKKLILVCGPAAIGKSTFSANYALEHPGEDVVVMESADYTLTLTEKGFAKVKGVTDGKAYFSGTYTKDANGNYGITTKYGTYTSVTEGSTVSMELHFPVTTGFGPFVQEIETVVNFTASV